MISSLSEALLATMAKAPLLDEYDVYQRLMDYWAETMQDDCYFVAADGWIAKPQRVLVEVTKGKDKGKMKDTGWECELLPKSFIIERSFADVQTEIEALELKRDDAESKLAEFKEEQSGDEGVFAKLDKVNKKEVTALRKEYHGDPDFAEELTLIDEWAALDSDLSAFKKDLKEASATLDAQALEAYEYLEEDDVRTIVVESKWLAAIEAALDEEVEQVSQRLTSRIRELAERYATPLPEINSEVEALTKRVNKHLKTMGARW